MLMFLVFFFQAEDGIRDRDVTGVQTCALPICFVGMHFTITGTGFMKCMPTKRSGRFVNAASVVIEIEDVLLAMMRSEERRVGKECRYGRVRNEYKEYVIVMEIHTLG